MASIRRTAPLKGHFTVGKEQHYAPSFMLGFRCRRSFVRALFLSFLAGFFWGLVSFPDLEDPTLSPPHGLFHDPDASSLNSISIDVEDVEEVRSPYNNLLIIVTPTYNRAAQGYHLTRLAQTLRLVPPPLLWIVVEMKRATEETADVLRRSGVMYRHLVCRKNTSVTLHRDVRQRHTALKHIKRHRLDGIVYFADDDNVYTLDLFHRLRQIRYQIVTLFFQQSPPVDHPSEYVTERISSSRCGLRRKGIQSGKRKGKKKEKEGKGDEKMRERKKKRATNSWNLAAASEVACGYTVSCGLVAAREVTPGFVVASKAPRLCTTSEAACSHELSLSCNYELRPTCERFK